MIVTSSGGINVCLTPDSTGCDYTTSSGVVAGIDLALAHVAAAHHVLPRRVLLAQADLLRPPFRNELFDLIWCVNTINHLKDPVQGLTVLKALLKLGGRISVGQSSFLPDMFFAWDARFERVITEALRRYYRERYGISETMWRTCAAWMEC